MNRGTILLSVASIMFFVSLADASKISRLDLAELPDRAEIIVLAKVLEVKQKGNTDEVTIKIASFLKGSIKHTTLTLPLVTRGGLKDFDPALRVGDMGAFFLREIKGSVAKKAYWGSIATFQKPNFVVSEKSKTQKSTDYTQWLANVLKEIETIKVGTTREQLLKVFTTEGGISHPTHRTYVHRACPYIKVEVRFETINKDRRSLKDNPEDVIKEISRPYLEWSIIN